MNTAHRFVLLLANVAVRSMLLAIVWVALERIWRSRSAEMRHALWRAMLVALLLFPALEVMLPPVWFDFGAHSKVVAVSGDTVIMTAHDATPKSNGLHISTSPVARSAPVPCMLIIAVVYVAAAIGLLARLALSVRHLKRIVDRSRFIASPRLSRVVQEAWLESGSLVKPRIRASADLYVPVAVESNNELFILLPEAWQRWEEQKLRTVMLHEMRHIARHDPSTALLSSLAVCVFWFHPLAWFLKRRLADLAEEACDEFAIRHIPTREHYARILLDFARDVAHGRGRVLASAASAIARTRKIERRIERIMITTPIHGGSLLSGRVLAVTVLTPALYVTSAARIHSQQTSTVHSWTAPINDYQAAKLEAELKTHPDDLELHKNLAMYYWNARQASDHIRQILWIIQRHPEDWSAAPMVSVRGGPENTPDDYQILEAAWERALGEHPNNADVLFHAARFLQSSDPERALQLLREAEQLDTSGNTDRYIGSKAAIYAAALAADSQIQFNFMEFTPELAKKLRSELESSNNPALLSAAGTELVQIATSPRHEIDVLKQQAFQLLQRAIDLDPANPKWQEALESAKWERVRRQNVEELMKPGTRCQ